MQDSILTKLDKGRELFRSGDYEKAEKYLLEALEKYDNYADVLNMLGVIAHSRNKIGAAQTYFERAIEINPNYTEAALNLAVTYNEQGKYRRAKEVHESAMSRRNDSNQQIEPYALGKITNMFAELAEACDELNMPDRAIMLYREALDLNPDFVDIRTKFGQLLKDKGNLSEATVQFKLVLDTKPDYIQAMISLGTTYYAMGKNIEALEQWKHALKVEPGNRTAGMYKRMIEQVLALEEAEASGVHMEVDKSGLRAPHRTEVAGDDIELTIDSEK